MVYASAVIWKCLFSVISWYGIVGVESWFDVVLTAPHYVGIGSSAVLICDHSVEREVLYKVQWLRNSKKFFQFIRDRKPPFKNFTLKGATVSWSENTESQLMLMNITTNASGYYSCEVSTDSPIFTKSSESRELVVIELQKESPKISFGKQSYRVGDWLLVNCTTKIQSHITWLINGVKVDSDHIKYYKGKVAELQLRMTEAHVPKIKLTCITGKGDVSHVTNTIFVEVFKKKPEPELKLTSSDLQVSCNEACPITISSLLLLLTLLQSGG
ncbi:uncharacterized protein LOC106668094 [Cimex lectularius]|uniref:Ig-like domain-containing protein n=1 Tax=Cimex lectularius TaxID=79782 RepID=A0A8I6RV62_CIMLE|nr:uncharacterized protein LOC106668094 [Cimex lectularius]